MAAFLVTAAPSAAAAAGPQQVALGVNTADAPGRSGASIDAFTAKAGRAPSIVMWFQSFSEPLFYSSQMPLVHDRGAVPMVTWLPETSSGPISMRGLANGSHDAYLRQAAGDARRWGREFFVRFAHEMNGGWVPWATGVNGNTAQDYIDAWRHVVTIFRQEGATNVKWVWSPNTHGYGVPRFEAFYPGDSWVDWVALDGYNWGSMEASGWRSFADVFGSSYDALVALTDKPVMATETASPEQGGNKAEWITSGLLQQLPSRMPHMRAVIWFDRNKEADWRIDSSVASLTAFRAAATSPLMGLDRAGLLEIGPRGQAPPEEPGPDPDPEEPQPEEPQPPVEKPKPTKPGKPTAPKPSAPKPGAAKPPAKPSLNPAWWWPQLLQRPAAQPRAALGKASMARGRRTLRFKVKLRGGACTGCRAVLTVARRGRTTRVRMAGRRGTFSASIRRRGKGRLTFRVELRDGSGNVLTRTKAQRARVA